MFSLIITIISIALVAALAIATIYYGGSAFTQGTAKANAAAIVSAAQQIAGANSLYQNDNSGTRATYSVITTAANGYMAGPPNLPAGASLSAIDTTTGYITGAIPTAAKTVCLAVNAAAGNTAGAAAVPAADSTAYTFSCSGTGPYVFTFHG